MGTGRIAAVLVTCFGVVAAAVLLGGWKTTTAGHGTTAGQPPVIIVPGSPRPTVADDIQIYAVTLKKWRPNGPIRIYERFCFRGEPCTSRPIPDRVRTGLAHALPGRVSFVDSPMHAITLDPARIAGATAQLRVQEGCGPMCIEGEGVQLAKSGGAWHLTGPTEGWIS